MRWTRQKWLVLLALVALFVVVVGTASLALDAPNAPPAAHNATGTPHGATSTPALATTAAPPTPTLVPADYIPPGWRRAGPDFAQAIVFAASDPAVGYVCGAQSGTIMVASTTDGGVIWGMPVAVDSGYDCALSVDPIHSGALAMSIQPCSTNGCPPDTPSFAVLERSDNNGATWRQSSLPPDGNQMGFGALIAWVGDTLFAQVLAGDAVVPRHYLAASVADGAFAWADANVAFAQPTTQLSLLAGSGTTLYAGFVQNGVAASCMAPLMANVIATSDGGQTWSAVLFTDQGRSVALVAGAADGQTLVGAGVDGHFKASRDNGQTWHLAPVVPTQTQTCALLVAPDGTFVAQFALDADAPASAVAIAPPGAATWQTLSAGTTNIALAAVATTSGHAVTLWAMTVGKLVPFTLAAYEVSL